MPFILCDKCKKTVEVWGRAWQYRLKYNKKDSEGRYLGWNCDRCADMEEGL